MTKQFHLLLVLLFSNLFVNTFSIEAQTKRETRAFINRTNFILDKAKNAVEFGKIYTGDLVKSIHHQHYAKALYREGNFNRAILHSYRARELAMIAIRANKGEITRDMELRRREEIYVRNRPDNAALDVDVTIDKNDNDRSVTKEKQENLND